MGNNIDLSNFISLLLIILIKKYIEGINIIKAIIVIEFPLPISAAHRKIENKIWLKNEFGRRIKMKYEKIRQKSEPRNVESKPITGNEEYSQKW